MANQSKHYRGTPHTRYASILIDPGANSAARVRNIRHWRVTEKASGIGVACWGISLIIADRWIAADRALEFLAVVAASIAIGYGVYRLVRRIRPDAVGVTENDVRHLSTINTQTPDAIDRAHRLLWTASTVDADLELNRDEMSPEAIETARQDISTCASEFGELCKAARVRA